VKGDEQIFVMGHVPMFSFKKDVIKPEKINDEIIVGLFNIFAKHNIIYICADTHNFSIMKIQLGNKVVIQITAGTGGADPDLLKVEYANTAKKCDVETVKTVKRVFHIEAFALNPYGYVSIKTERVKSGTGGTGGTSITVCYKKIDVNTVNIFTYSFDMDTKMIKSSTTSTTPRATKASPSISYKTVGHKVCSSIPPSSDYITSIKPNVLCYKKKIIKKEKSSKVI
jgi:uncharacterized membrane protein YccF (DUF307 family)